MTEAERRRVRQREKRTAYLRSIGQPVEVDPAPAVAHARHLHQLGMSAADMAAQSRLTTNFFGDLIRGRRTKDKGGQPIKVIDRADLQDVLAVQFVPPAKQGAKLESIGSRRRLRALILAGFGGMFLARELGVAVQRVHMMLTGDGPMAASTITRITELYEKYRDADPAEVGLSAYTISRSKGDARRRGYAPASAWDDETIDDPDSIPEYTGRCGTRFGMVVHRREGIEVCTPCQEAFTGELYPGFKPELLRALRERHGLSRVRLADMVEGVNSSTIQYWEDGRSKPERQFKLDAILDALDATYEDVCEDT
jgi:DNA-binding XRE family transcriptional regulator